MFILLRLTFREMLRKRIFLAAIILAFVYLGLFGAAMHYALAPVPLASKADVMLILLAPGVFVGGFLTAFLTVLLSSGLIAGDIEDGTIQTILVKPLPRWKVLLGRFAGGAAALLLFSALLYGGMAGIGVYEAAGSVGNPTAGRLLISVLLYLLFPLSLMAFSLVAGVSMSPMASGVATGGLYFCGVIAGFVEQIGLMMGQGAMYYGGILLSLLSPGDVIMRQAKTVLAGNASGSTIFGGTGGFSAMAQPSEAMLLWAVFWTAALVVLAVRLFQKRDI